MASFDDFEKNNNTNPAPRRTADAPARSGAPARPTGGAARPASSRQIPEGPRTRARRRRAARRRRMFITVLAVVAVIAIVIVAVHFLRGTKATAVNLDRDSAAVKIGETLTLTATVEPEDTKDKTVTWTSSDENVATVAEGVITGVAQGSCTVTVTTKNGLTDTCSVTVLPAGPDMKAIFDQYCAAPFSSLSEDGRSIFIDTSPEGTDVYYGNDAYQAITDVNTALGLPESVLIQMSQTRSSDGEQSYTLDSVEVRWAYSPDKGLEVTYYAN